MKTNIPSITFKEFDKFKLDEFAAQLRDFLITEHSFVDGALVTSLEAPFGCGKSTFFDLFENWLRTDPSSVNPYTLIVRLNAWESDFGDDPVLAIISAITGAIKEHSKTISQPLLKKLQSQAGFLASAATSIASDLLQEKLGFDAQKAIESGKDAWKKDEAGLVVFKTYEARKKALRTIKDTLAKLAEKWDLKILLLVDELDRCRPSYAVDYLESLKHIFDQRNLTIILGIDPKQMASSVQSLFGGNLVFDEYFRKFAHRRVPLKGLGESNLAAFFDSLWRRYFSPKTGEFRYVIQLDGLHYRELQLMFLRYEVTGRQAHEIFRIVSHCLRVPAALAGNLSNGWGIAAIFMALFSVVRPTDFLRIGTRKISAKELRDCLNIFLNDNNKWEFWVKFFIAGTARETTDDEMSQSIQAFGMSHQQLEQVRQFDRTMFTGRKDQSPFEELYQRIVSLGQFAQ